MGGSGAGELVLIGLTFYTFQLLKDPLFVTRFIDKGPTFLSMVI